VKQIFHTVETSLEEAEGKIQTHRLPSGLTDDSINVLSICEMWAKQEVE
jgi:hypothetical protein